MDCIAPQERAQAAEQGNNRRRRYIIDSRFQWKFVLTISLTVFVVTSILSSVLYGVLHQQARQRFIDPTNYTAEVTMVVIAFGVLFSMVAAFAVGVWCMLATHRICGPLYVLKSQLDHLAAGQWPEVRNLRKKDEFKAVYASFCAALDTIKNRRQASARAVDEVIAKAGSAAAAAAGQQKRAFEELIQQLQALRNSFA